MVKVFFRGRRAYLLNWSSKIEFGFKGGFRTNIFDKNIDFDVPKNETKVFEIMHPVGRKNYLYELTITPNSNSSYVIVDKISFFGKRSKLYVKSKAKYKLELISVF